MKFGSGWNSSSFSFSLTQWEASLAVFHPFCCLPFELCLAGPGWERFLRLEKIKTAPELGCKKDYFHNLASLVTKQLLLVTARYSRMNPRCIYHSLPPLGAVVRFSCSLCEPRMRRRCIHVLLGKSMLFVRSLLVKPLRLTYCFVSNIVFKHNTCSLVI